MTVDTLPPPPPTLFSFSPEGIEYPRYMPNFKSGAWMLWCTPSGGYIMVNGEVVKRGYIPEEKMSTLKVPGVCSVFP